MSSRKSRTFAAIDIGTTGVRMALADIDDKGQIHFLEKLNQSVRLGRDVFSLGRIRRGTIEECVRILESFQQVLEEYQVREEDVRVVASSAVQEATNRESLVDRVAMATGLEIEVIDDAEATRLTYLSVLPFLQDGRRKKKKANTLVLEIGGGRTELLELDGLNILGSRVVRLGSLRIRNQLEQQRSSFKQMKEVLEQEVSNTLLQLQGQFQSKNLSLILLGGEARFMANQVNPEWDRSQLQTVSMKDWKQLAADLLNTSVEQTVEQYHLTFAEAETLVPALYAYQRLAEELGCRQLQVSGFTMRDGILREAAQRDGWTESYKEQMLESALNLGRKFHLDENHAQETAGLSLQLFDELVPDHKLGQRHRVLLEIAALLHEIGTFISATSHHKHSMYILANASIFGLGQRDSRIVANVARYHRRSMPKSTHPMYQSLSRRDRIVVQQLSAILRVADALARSRGRRIQRIVCERRDETLFIHVPDVDNLHLENSALRVKGKMFQQVFGMNVIFVKG